MAKTRVSDMAVRGWPTMVMPFNLVQTPGEIPVLYLHDDVGKSFWDDEADNSSQAWATVLDQITADRVQVRINSRGGYAWDGIAIYNLLKAHPATVEVVVDGIAASAASVIAMAGDTITMCTGSAMMIHDASGGCWGTATDMRDTADALDVCSDSAAAIYAERAGGTVAQWRDRMSRDTWLTPDQAIELGLADEIDSDVEVDTTVTSAMSYVPARQVAGLIKLSASEVGDEHTKNKENIMTDVLKSLVDRLGLAENTSVEQALVALDEALTPVNQAVTVPDGTVLVDKVAWDQIQTDALKGAEALAVMKAQQIETILDQAMAEGRFAPSARATYKTVLETNLDMGRDVLAALAPNTIPVAPVGYSSDGSLDATQAMRAELIRKMDGEAN